MEVLPEGFDRGLAVTMLDIALVPVVTKKDHRFLDHWFLVVWVLLEHSALVLVSEKFIFAH